MASGFPCCPSAGQTGRVTAGLGLLELPCPQRCAGLFPASWVPRNRMQVARTGSLTWWGLVWDQVTPTATGQGEGDRPHGAGPAGAVCVLGLWLQGRPCGWSSSQTLPSGVLPRAQGSPHVGSRGVKGGSSVHGSHAHTQLTQQGDSPHSLPGQGAPPGVGACVAGGVAGSAPVRTGHLLLARVGDPFCGWEDLHCSRRVSACLLRAAAALSDRGPACCVSLIRALRSSGGS